MASVKRMIVKAATRKSWPDALTWLLFALFLFALPIIITSDWATLARFLVYATAFVLLACVVKLLHQLLFTPDA